MFQRIKAPPCKTPSPLSPSVAITNAQLASQPIHVLTCICMARSETIARKQPVQAKAISIPWSYQAGPAGAFASAQVSEKIGRRWGEKHEPQPGRYSPDTTNAGIWRRHKVGYPKTAQVRHPGQEQIPNQGMVGPHPALGRRVRAKMPHASRLDSAIGYSDCLTIKR